jgi:hypothetical protein
MVTKKTSKKAGKKGRVKTLTLKRESIKDLNRSEKKKIKGGGGIASSVLRGT